jgi:Ca2+-binding RTX toxin-like protein
MRPSFEILEDRTVPASVSLSVNNTVLTYQAGGQEYNNVSFTTSIDVLGNVSLTIQDIGSEVGGADVTISCAAPFQGGNAPGVAAVLPNSAVTRIVVWLSDLDDAAMNGTPIVMWAHGEGGNDTLFGGGGDDKLLGEADNDYLVGAEGNDSLYGEGGNDTLKGFLGDDRLYGDDGTDELWGDAGQDSLYGGIGDDTLRGGQDDDYLSGAAGNDTLYGEDGADYLTGGDGNDCIMGGAGTDTLWGNAGIDTFLGEESAEIQDLGEEDIVLI